MTFIFPAEGAFRWVCISIGKSMTEKEVMHKRNFLCMLDKNCLKIWGGFSLDWTG